MKHIGVEISRKLLHLLSVPKEPVSSSLPGLWKYPTNRDDAIKSSTSWIKGKQADDGAEGLWRVRDDLYDLSGFVDKHPGGAEWLEITKGTDITEAFEAHHLNPSTEKHLKQLHVRRAKSQRNSPYTFREDGFYKTLKKKVRVVLGDDYSGPTFESKLITDLLLTGTLVSTVLSAAFRSYGLAVVSGSFLALTAIAAHNFFHQKDNFRMYYFHLCFLSSRIQNLEIARALLLGPSLELAPNFYNQKLLSLTLVSGRMVYDITLVLVWPTDDREIGGLENQPLPQSSHLSQLSIGPGGFPLRTFLPMVARSFQDVVQQIRLVVIQSYHLQCNVSLADTAQVRLLTY
uniref:Cytochrome b5-related protein n=1 Tax=Timema douglasi TaxID=61478 RepID=A0A7R8VM35_TIMDO|nr:unnamed protein product [Timema douglasi]